MVWYLLQYLVAYITVGWYSINVSTITLLLKKNYLLFVNNVITGNKFSFLNGTKL